MKVAYTLYCVTRRWTRPYGELEIWILYPLLILIGGWWRYRIGVGLFLHKWFFKLKDKKCGICITIFPHTICMKIENLSIMYYTTVEMRHVLFSSAGLILINKNGIYLNLRWFCLECSENSSRLFRNVVLSSLIRNTNNCLAFQNINVRVAFRWIVVLCCVCFGSIFDHYQVRANLSANTATTHSTVLWTWRWIA